MSLSIVTVCMNRRQHLLATAPQVAAWPNHGEHLIVDWSSRQPLRRQELPADPRLRLLRVEGEARWNLCRAYNFAVSRAAGDWILKLDADTWPTEAWRTKAWPTEAWPKPGGGGRDWVDEVWGLPPPPPPSSERVTEGAAEAPGYAFGCGPEGRKGQFLMSRQLFAAVGGFNEHLIGYGFDDKDLQARLALQTGQGAATLPAAWIGVIAHSDAERAGQGCLGRLNALEASRALAAMRASRLSNRLLAAHCPWSGRVAGSEYRELSSGVWQVEAASLPQLSAEVADEIDHVRRMSFWGCFLAIPEVFLAELPLKLVPPSHRGRWEVRWWHRLWWHSGRRLMHLPVGLLSLSRGRMQALQAAISPGRRR